MIMKTLSIFILSASAIFCGEAEEPKLPAAVQSILNKAESAVQKNRIAYDNANEKAFAETEKQLKVELDKLTKAGKLEEALAVKKTMESFRTDVVAKVDESIKNKENMDLLGEKKGIRESLYGKWNVVGIWSGSIELKNNGSVIGLHNNTSGKWEMKNDKLIIVWTHFQGGETYDITNMSNELSGMHTNTQTGVSGSIRIIRQK